MKENQLSKKNTPGISCSFCETSNYTIFFFLLPRQTAEQFCTANTEESKKTEDRNKRRIARSSAILQDLTGHFILNLYSDRKFQSILLLVLVMYRGLQNKLGDMSHFVYFES